MMLLRFSIGNDSYGLDSARIVEVIPLVQFRPVPHTPAYVPGCFLYRGTMVPVIDLSMLLSGHPARQRLGTRVIVVNRADDEGVAALLGLLAENITDTVRYHARDLEPSNIAPPEAPYLGRILTDAGEMIQLIQLEQLLPESLKKALFSDRQ